MRKEMKIFLCVCVAAVLGLSLWVELSDVLLRTTPAVRLSAPVEQTAPAASADAHAPAQSRDDELWATIDAVGLPLKLMAKGNYSADYDWDENRVVYTIWMDGITLYALDLAARNAEAYDSWQSIIHSVCLRSAELQDAFAESSFPETTVVLNLVACDDYETLCLSAENGAVQFDLVASRLSQRSH